jgi:uncharacterized membrane protein YcaP (DUF421 family)
MIQKIFIIAIKSTIAYTVLLFLGRLIGRKLISRITFFDFVVGIALGSLAVRISLGNENSIWLGILSAAVITALVLLTDFFNIRSWRFRKIEEGEPVVLIEKGKLLNRNLAKVRVSVSKLLMLLRQKDAFYLEDVDYAVMENNGQLSVLLKADRLPSTAGELNISRPEHAFPVDIIVDGKVIPENLKASCHDETWLQQQLQDQGIGNPGQVFYASINKTDGLYISEFHQKG